MITYLKPLKLTLVAITIWLVAFLFNSWKAFLAAILFSLIATLSYAQENFTINGGGTSQKNYFAEIKYEDIGGIPIIKATIHGKTYRLMLDTGAPNVITKALFDELNPHILTRMLIGDANGKADSLNIVSLNEITVGNIVFNDIPAIVPNNQSIFDCFRVDGIIGSNMLRNSILHISSKTRKIIITDQPGKLNLDPKQSTDLFLTLQQSSPLVKIKLAGKGSGTIPTVFDTGSAGFFDIALSHFAFSEQAEIFNVLAKAKGVNSMSLYGPGTDTTQYLLRVPELSVNGAAFNNVGVNTSPDNDSRIGSRLLNYGVVTVDYKNKKFYFEPFATPVDMYQESFPVSFRPKDNKVWIGMIWEEKLKGQINVNDQVLAIDDVDYTNISMCDFILKTDLYEGKNRAVLTLQTSNGTIKKVTISKN